MAEDFGFAPPPFKPDEALLRLKRELRELGLAEREGLYERRGLAVARARARAADSGIDAAIVAKPSRNSPQWRARNLGSSAAVRDFVAELKKALAQWGDRDD